MEANRLKKYGSWQKGSIGCTNSVLSVGEAALILSIVGMKLPNGHRRYPKSVREAFTALGVTFQKEAL